MQLGRVAVALAAFSAGLSQAATTYSPAKPPAIPLAVKSPYLNTWMDGDVLAGTWPTFWTGEITGWQGFISVDGNVFNFMGGASGPAPANQTAFEYTSTRSIFTFDVDSKVTLTVTFLSPVYPDDLLKQSLQFSYVEVSVKSSDGSNHRVSVYMDCSGEWASGDRTKVIEWAHGTSNNVAYHTFNLQSQTTFQESGDQANWGNWYISTSSGNGLTYQIGQDVVVRGQYRNHSKLANTVDSKFRAIQDDYPVFAFAQDLGQISSNPASVLFTLGVAQTQVINFLGTGSSAQALSAYWTSAYQNGQDAMAAFFGDYGDASSYASSLDERINTDSLTAAGQNYATITTLTLREAFGGLTPAVGSQPYIFLKEISSDSDTQTVDVIFPMHPVLLYLNATLLKLTLEPLYQNQQGGHWPYNYSIHDLGAFPNALGHAEGNDEQMPLEECGNMIIMTLAYAQRTGDNGYLSQNWGLLSQWAEYLIQYAEFPDNQLSTDDFAGSLANQTNLALKGIIGLKAMGQIANLTGHQDNYTAVAESYLGVWKQYGISSGSNPPHTVLAYNDDDSWGLLYNLYADTLLGLNFIGESVYTMQSNFYPTVALEYGVPLDTRHDWIKGDWECWAAAVASNTTRDLLLSSVVKFIGGGGTRLPLTDLWDGTNGGLPDNGPSFDARPVMGGTFALLALK